MDRRNDDNVVVTPSVVELSGPLPVTQSALEPSVEATVALARRRLIAHTIASEISCRAPQNCEGFLHLIFDHVGGGQGSVCATGHCFDAFFRSELTEGRAHAGSYSSVDSHTPFNWARQRTSFGTRGSQVQILPLRSVPHKRCCKPASSCKTLTICERAEYTSAYTGIRRCSFFCRSGMFTLSVTR